MGAHCEARGRAQQFVDRQGAMHGVERRSLGGNGARTSLRSPSTTSTLRSINCGLQNPPAERPTLSVAITMSQPRDPHSSPTQATMYLYQSPHVAKRQPQHIGSNPSALLSRHALNQTNTIVRA